MAEHSLRNVYNWQHLLYCGINISASPPFPLFPLSPLRYVFPVFNWNVFLFTTFGCTIPSTMKMSIPNIQIMLWQDILILNCRKKVNKNDDSLAHLYKCKFVFWQKEKWKIGTNIRRSLQFYGVIFWWKKGTLKRNCPAAISKMRTTSITTKYFCHQPPKWTNIFFM